MIIGADPRDPCRIWETLYASTRDFGQKGAYIEAMSAIDIALWDIFGKSTGQPLHRLLGGAFRTHVPAYATGCYYCGEDYLDIDRAVQSVTEEARGYVRDGFQTLKIKIGLLSVEHDLRRVEAIREAVGPHTLLLADANHAYNAFTAVRMGRGLQENGVRWFEEPVPPEDREGYRHVRDSLDLAIAGGECEFTRYGFRDLFTAGCVDIAQPDVCVCGGVSEFRKIQALASAFGVWVIPHVWGSGVALATALHIQASIPPFPHSAQPIALQNEPVIEYDRNHNPLRDDLLRNRIELIDGKLPVPQGPGLGIDIDEDVLHRYMTESQQVNNKREGIT
jgi:D-galactarolactone cycloisomerase